MKIKKLLTLFTLISIAGFGSAFSAEGNCPDLLGDLEADAEIIMHNHSVIYPHCDSEEINPYEDDYFYSFILKRAARNDQAIAEAAASKGLLSGEMKPQKINGCPTNPTQSIIDIIPALYPNCDFSEENTSFWNEWNKIERRLLILSAARRYDHVEIMQAALEGHDINTRIFNETLLVHAVEEGLSLLVLELIKHPELDINALSSEGDSALTCALWEYTRHLKEINSDDRCTWNGTHPKSEQYANCERTIRQLLDASDIEITKNDLHIAVWGIDAEDSKGGGSALTNELRQYADLRREVNDVDQCRMNGNNLLSHDCLAIKTIITELLDVPGIEITKKDLHIAAFGFVPAEQVASHDEL